jgi:integrase
MPQTHRGPTRKTQKGPGPLKESGADIASVLAAASPPWTWFCGSPIWTGQRQGDPLRLRWSDYDGAHIRLRQSKTGRAVVIVVSDELRPRLEGAERTLTILANR